jgi:hypothetical protein
MFRVRKSTRSGSLSRSRSGSISGSGARDGSWAVTIGSCKDTKVKNLERLSCKKNIKKWRTWLTRDPRTASHTYHCKSGALKKNSNLFVFHGTRVSKEEFVFYSEEQGKVKNTTLLIPWNKNKKKKRRPTFLSHGASISKGDHAFYSMEKEYVKKTTLFFLSQGTRISKEEHTYYPMEEE